MAAPLRSRSQSRRRDLEQREEPRNGQLLSRHDERGCCALPPRLTASRPYPPASLLFPPSRRSFFLTSLSLYYTRFNSRRVKARPADRKLWQRTVTGGPSHQP